MSQEESPGSSVLHMFSDFILRITLRGRVSHINSTHEKLRFKVVPCFPREPAQVAWNWNKIKAEML